MCRGFDVAVHVLFDLLNSSINFSRVLNILDIVFARRSLYFAFLCNGMNNLVTSCVAELAVTLAQDVLAKRANVKNSLLSEA